MAVLTQVGIPGSGNGILAPKLKHRFQVKFVGIARLAGNNGRDLQAQVINASRPQLEFETVQLDRYNSRAYVGSEFNQLPFARSAPIKRCCVSS